MNKELLTASRMAALMACPRKHYWRYERKLRAVRDSAPLRFGTAWHRALEARFAGSGYEEALRLALETSAEIDPYEAATLQGLLSAYWHHYGHAETGVTGVQPEIGFDSSIEGTRKFAAAGKIDGVGFTPDGRLVLVEHKTVGEDISDTSDYWQRLLRNDQVCQYVLGASALYGREIDSIVYDVARKPVTKPAENVPFVDEKGLKIVLDANGDRVFKKNGEPKQTADKEKGEYVYGAKETPEAYAQRICDDACARPEFYFARKEVAVTHDALEEFKANRLELVRLIQHYRRRKYWPLAHGAMTCRFCEFAGFCLMGHAPAEGEPAPDGFEYVDDPNTELAR
jgi:hypothetical protein